MVDAGIARPASTAYRHEMQETSADTTRLLDAAMTAREAAHRAARGSATIESVLTTLVELIPFDEAGLFRWDAATGRHVNLSTGAMSPTTAEFIETELHRDPIFKYVQRTHQSLWLSDMPERMRRMSSTVRDLIEPSGFAEGTTQCLFSTDGRYVGVLNLALTRPTTLLPPVRSALTLLLDSLAAAVDPVSRIGVDERAPDMSTGYWATPLPDCSRTRLGTISGDAPPDLLAGHSPLTELIDQAARSRPLPATILVPHGQQLLELRLTRSGTTTHVQCRAATRPAGLSLRELHVMAELTRGRTNRQIADNLSIAPRTVATHIEHILAKLDIPNRAAAAAKATAWGLEPAPAQDGKALRLPTHHRFSD